MKSKKFLKALAALAVGTVMTSSFAFAACDNGNNPGDTGDNGGGTTHTHAYGEWKPDSATQHKKECANDGCDQPVVKENHKMKDNKCEVCGYESGSETPPGPSGPTVTAETSEGYKSFIAEGTVVYSNSFDTAADVPYGADAATSAGGAKVYGSLNNDATGYLDDAKVSIKDGNLAIEDKEDGHSVFGHIVLDEAVADKKVTVRLEYKYDTEASGWTQVFLYNGSDEIMALRTTSKTALGYRVTKDGNPNGSLSISTNTLITVEISLDLVLGTVEVKGASGSGALTTIVGDTALAAGATSLTEIRFGTATKDRSIYASNVAIKTEEVSLDAYKTVYDNKVAGYNTTYSQYDTFSSDVADAKAAYDSATQNATDKATIDAAYNAYVLAIVGTLKQKGVAHVQSNYPANNYTVEGEEGNKTEYEAAINDLSSALASTENPVTTIEDAWGLIADAVETINALPTNDYLQKKTVTVTVKAKYGDPEALQDIGTFTVKSGEEISFADILTKLNVPTGYVVKGLYTNEALTEGEITDKYTADTVEVDTAVTLYAKIAMVTSYQVTFDGKGNVNATGGLDTTGWTYTNKTGGDVTYKNTKYTTGVKLNSSGSLKIVLSKAATITFYCTNAVGIKVNDGAQQAATAVEGETGVFAVSYTFAAAGTYTITRGAGTEHWLFLLEVEE